MANGNTFYLFIYDGMMKGGPNHKQIAAAKPLGPARTARAEFQMRAYQSARRAGSVSPGVVYKPVDGSYIEGELYEVSPELLTTLDSFKGVNRHGSGVFERRQRIEIKGGFLADIYLRKMIGDVTPPRDHVSQVQYDAVQNSFRWIGNHAH